LPLCNFASVLSRFSAFANASLFLPPLLLSQNFPVTSTTLLLPLMRLPVYIASYITQCLGSALLFTVDLAVLLSKPRVSRPFSF
jgi:hypothetical protein